MDVFEKLSKEYKEGKYGKKAAAMKSTIYDAIVDFCKNNEEFARAVEQGGSFEDCMKAVEKGVGSSISDLDAIKKAVQFYFPGADVRFQMQIQMSKYENEAPTVQTSIIDLSEFL